MTEQEWMECQDPLSKFDSLRNAQILSERRLRLTACACYRHRFWHDDLSRAVKLLHLVERFADGQESEDTLARVNREARNHLLSSAALPNATEAVRALLESIPGELAWPAGPAGSAAYYRALQAENVALCELLRHIFGNPFRPHPAPECWPAIVTQLANALYNGEDCGFALHDALLEAGHPELAEHFRHEQGHPKGCWVLDVVLGRA